MRSIKFLFFLALVALPVLLAAQIPPANASRGNMPGNPAQLNIGRFYGKVLDESTGKGLAYASVQLSAMRFDSTSRSMKEVLLAGQLTEENGDFSLENLPAMGQFTLKISFMGYASLEQKVSFGLTPGGRPGAGFDPGKLDKDLGNITLATSSKMLKEVTVSGEASVVSLALDKKVYKVDKNAVAAGGNAEDALKNVPSLTVDIDGNVAMRNAAPQIFVDGRPTTLALDQIPADAIDNIEVISNPSAKYDASGGTAGIINIVLKKERRVGYNGSIRAGIDKRGRGNLNGDLNARQGKINVFLSGGYSARKSIGNGETDRYNLFGSPLTNVYQSSNSENGRGFINSRAGIDWFVDNRNTLTLTGNFHGGRFRSFDELGIQTDTLLSAGRVSTFATRNSDNTRQWKNLGSQLLYKHLFPKEGKEWTADLNYNSSRWDNKGFFATTYQQSATETRQQQNGEGDNQFVTVQTDYVDPIGPKMKIEAGARAAIRNYNSENGNFQYDFQQGAYVRTPGFADKYKFNDQVYAAYATFSNSYSQWGYQLGLRAESSTYTGTLIDIDSTFSNEFPLSLFPSVFLTYKLNEEDNVQLSYTRRINRPNFFQLVPFPDFSDSLLLSRGNPGLIPEFTNSLEASYQNIFNRAHNLLATVYYKQTTNLITSYQYSEFNAALNREVIVSTFANSNSSQAYGLELTLKNTFWSKIELTSNLNFYNSIVNARNIESNLSNEQFTWFVKENLSIKLPAQLTLQLSGEYQSRTAVSLSNPSMHGGWRGGPSSSAQGYTIPNWFVDVSLRKDLWNRTASISLAVQDIFRSRRSGSHSESIYFVQDSWRRRDPQFVRLNFSWRFGKFDASLFKRKNNKVNAEGMDSGF
ncbi:MAG: TonB-dependent receptor [Saprospiraceae bacterium]|nr:TonB-dependent receptor [Saprospiraceae bacterium]